MEPRSSTRESALTLSAITQAQVVHLFNVCQRGKHDALSWIQGSILLLFDVFLLKSSHCRQGWELNVGPEQAWVSRDGRLGLSLSQRCHIGSASGRSHRQPSAPGDGDSRAAHT